MAVEGLIKFDGADADFIWFSTHSWTGGPDDYTIAICKRTGIVSCTCMDASCRRKRDLITAEQPRICKHAQAVLRWADQLTGGNP